MKLSKRLLLNRAERPDEWEMDEFIRTARHLEAIEHEVIISSIKSLAKTCAGDEVKIIDMLTGYLFDEEEASEIKGCL